MPRLGLIFPHLASADGCNELGLLPASSRLRFAPSKLNQGNEGTKTNGCGSCIRALSASDHSIQLRKAVIASTVGTAIEWVWPVINV
jgi:hypothetical protein